MNLILAQGAEHTKPENMAKILKVIEQERNGIADKMYKSASDCEHKNRKMCRNYAKYHGNTKCVKVHRTSSY